VKIAWKDCGFHAGVGLTAVGLHDGLDVCRRGGISRVMWDEVGYFVGLGGMSVC
jgi:hypothetical protein